mmetsp:Transcript_1513/g.3185  ORF Transcript_1513/g.3185 Transcript_1513/m.3185 type:complete len:107 (+) Transcript_1513:946-1266(+)
MCTIYFFRDLSLDLKTHFIYFVLILILIFINVSSSVKHFLEQTLPANILTHDVRILLKIISYLLFCLFSNFPIYFLNDQDEIYLYMPPFCLFCLWRECAIPAKPKR